MSVQSRSNGSFQVRLLIAAIIILSGQSLADSGSRTSSSMGPWGVRGDVPLAGDFDRDGFADDLAIFRPSQSNWLFDLDHNGNTDVSTRMGPGGVGDRFTVGDFDRDGYVNDLGVFTSTRMWYFGTFSYRPDTGVMVWSFLAPAMTWGLGGDLPVAGDFNADGYRDDVAVFRPSNRIWYINTDLDDTTDRRSGPWANSGDLPIAGDFNGDNEVGDVGVFRASDRIWYFNYDVNGNTDRRTGPWALSGDQPIVGDFDGDGYTDDIGVFRRSTGEWFFQYQITHWTAPGMTGGQPPGYVNA